MLTDDHLLEQETFIHWDQDPNGQHFIYTAHRPTLTKLKKMGYKLTVGGNFVLPKGSVKMKDLTGGGFEQIF